MSKRKKQEAILLVEDELMIAEDLAEALSDAGYEVVGPVGHVAQAVTTARSTDVDAAILDVNLHGEQVFPVADTLRERNIPFVFVTGYTALSMPDRFGKHQTLRKPVKYNELWTALSRLKRPEPGETGH
jgi:DNA-binding response OmpR family regulator